MRDPSNPDPDFLVCGFVRGERVITLQNEMHISATISNNGDLVLNGAVNQSYHASVDYTHWKPNTYFPEQVEDKIASRKSFLFVSRFIRIRSEIIRQMFTNRVLQASIKINLNLS